MKNKILFAFVVIVALQTVANAQSSATKNRDVPANCEYAAAVVSTVNNLKKDDNIIIISRLGDGEYKRSVGLKRLAEVKRYLIKSWKRDLKTIILAEGERTKGKGRLEFYVVGMLFDTLFAKKNKVIPFYCKDH